MVDFLFEISRVCVTEDQNVQKLKFKHDWKTVVFKIFLTALILRYRIDDVWLFSRILGISEQKFINWTIFFLECDKNTTLLEKHRSKTEASVMSTSQKYRKFHTFFMEVCVDLLHEELYDVVYQKIAKRFSLNVVQDP